MRLKSAVLAVAILVGSAAFAQTPAPPKTSVPTPAVPQLKPEVALELTQLQNSLLRLSSQMQVMQTQYQDLKKRFDETQTSFFTQQTTALKRSGIDDTKYILNPDTLQVAEKPAPPPEAPKPTTDKK